MTDIAPQTVLLTLGRLPPALELARALRAGGLRVIAADPYRWPLARLSRSVSRCYRVSAPAHDAAQWSTDIASIVAREQVSWVLPVSEEILHVASLKALLPARCRLCCMPLATLVSLHDKWYFAQLATRLKLPVPATVLADDRRAARVAGGTGFVIKPRLSCSGNGVSLHDGDDWPADEPLGRERIVQQRLSGASCCTLTLAREGCLVHTVAYRSLVDFGSVSVCFEQMPLPGTIHDGIRSIVSDLQYSGFIGFDALCDAEGNWHFIECNPRATSGVHLFPPALLCGLCTPSRIDSDRRRASAAEQSDAVDTVGTRNATDTADTAATTTACQEARQEFWSSLSVFLGKLLSGRLDRRHACLLFRTPDITWRWRDPMPFLLVSVVLLPQLLRALRERRPVVQLITEDVGSYERAALEPAAHSLPASGDAAGPR